MNNQAINISPIELLALKKLAVICDALARKLADKSAAREQLALTKVLLEVISRADFANVAAKARDKQIAS